MMHFMNSTKTGCVTTRTKHKSVLNKVKNSELSVIKTFGTVEPVF
jgi:hypothetical protein